MSPLRIVAFVGLLLLAPSLAHAQRERLSQDDVDIVEKRWPDAKKTWTSIRYVVQQSGDPSQALLKPGDQVMVLYVGALLSGKVFDKQQDRTKPFTFRVARGEVIDGWNQILQLMRPGDHWTVIVPPELAYGRKGMPPAIPPDTALVFDVEVIGVKREG